MVEDSEVLVEDCQETAEGTLLALFSLWVQHRQQVEGRVHCKVRC